MMINQQINEKEFKNKLEIEIDNEYTKVRETEEKNKEEEKSNELPDLIVIDGGKGHLNVALKTLKKIGLEKIECISLAKENEEIFLPFTEISILSCPQIAYI